MESSFDVSDTKLVFINGEVKGLCDSESLSPGLKPSRPAPAPLHPRSFKHFITDELRGNGFSNISLTLVSRPRPANRLGADGGKEDEDDSPTIPDACLMIGQGVGDVGAVRGPTTQLQ